MALPIVNECARVTVRRPQRRSTWVWRVQGRNAIVHQTSRPALLLGEAWPNTTSGDQMIARDVRARWLTVIVITAVAFLSFSGPAAAKACRITEVAINAELGPDGRIDVSEKRTYTFDGAYTHAYRELPRPGPVFFDDFKVLEGGEPYALSESKQPGTCTISETSDKIRVTWYYRARNETRTFEFRYRASNAVERYEDAAVLYFKFIGEEWDIRQDNVVINIRPPRPLPDGALNEWLHGPLWASSSIAADGSIAARCERLPAGAFLEVRALYPPDAFPEVEARVGSVRSEIMAQEAQWARDANRARDDARRRLAERQDFLALGKWVTPPIMLAAMVAWWWIYRAFTRRPTLPRLPTMASEIPDRTPPALVAYLLSGRQVPAKALVATLLDLAERGFVVFSDEAVEKTGAFGGTKRRRMYRWEVKRAFWNQHAGQLADFESSLLNFIFNDLSKGRDAISTDEIKKGHQAFAKFCGKWQKTVAARGREKNWYDADSIRGMYYSLVLGFVMVGVTILLAFLFGLWAAPLGGVALAIIILSFLVPHRTPEGETKARQWRAVLRYLRSRQFRNEAGPKILSQVPAYLIYGAVMGLSASVYRELAALIPDNERTAYLPWYAHAGGGEFSPADFGAGFSSMVAAASSAVSTAAGVGGGASGGGGGGAGGGGGGAG